MNDKILLNLKGTTKEEVLLEIARFAKKAGLFKDEQAIYRMMLANEKTKPSAVGFGLAFPTVYSDLINTPLSLIFCRTLTPVEFNSPDKEPVSLILATFVQKKAPVETLKTMAKIAGLLRQESVREALLKAKGEDEIRLLMKESRRWN